MITSETLLDLVVAAVRDPRADAPKPVYATDAGENVFRPADWPTQDGQYPRLKLRVIRETKQSLARSGPPEFTVTTVVRIVGEVSELAEEDDAGATAAEQSLWRLARQAEVAVIGSYPLMRAIQQIASVDSQLAYSSDGEAHLAGIQVDIAIEWYQGPEAFAPVEADDLDEIAIAATAYPPVGLQASLQP